MEWEIDMTGCRLAVNWASRCRSSVLDVSMTWQKRTIKGVKGEYSIVLLILVKLSGSG